MASRNKIQQSFFEQSSIDRDDLGMGEVLFIDQFFKEQPEMWVRTYSRTRFRTSLFFACDRIEVILEKEITTLLLLSLENR
jgi:hypothetical protein